MGTTYEVGANIRLDADKALAGLARVSGAVGRVSGHFDRLSGLVGRIAAVGGTLGAALSFERVVTTAKDHFKMLERISRLTNVTTREADAMVDVFQSVGIQGEVAERVLLGMSRRASMMNMGMSMMQVQARGTRGLFQQLGVDVRKGVLPSLEKLSKLYKQGKVDVGQLGYAFGVPRQQALDLVKLLEKGPEHIRKTADEARKTAIGEEQMRMFQRMREAGIVASEAFQRMQIIVGAELFPVLAELMEGAAARIKEWMPAVRRFGEFLRDNLTQALGLVVKIGKVLLANYAIMKLTGVGILGHAARYGRWAMAAAPAGGAGARIASGLLGVGIGTPQGMAGLVPMLGSLARIGSIIGRFTAIGAVLTFAIYAFKVIKENTLGIRDTLLQWWERMKAHAAVIAKLFEPVMKAFGGDGTIGQFFSVLVVSVIEGLTKSVEGLMLLITTLTLFFKDAFSGARGYAKAMLHPIDALGDAAIEAAKMQREAVAKQRADTLAQRARTIPGERGGTNFNFPNARFDITQKFEEGFDPDRIAVAFANDLAALGERKLQSGFAPLYAVR